MKPKRSGAYEIGSAHLALYFARKADEATARAAAALSNLQDACELLASRYPAMGEE